MARRRRRNFFYIPRSHQKKFNKLLTYAFIGLLMLTVIDSYPIQSILLFTLIPIGIWYYRYKQKQKLRMSGIYEIDRMEGKEFENRIKLLYEDLGYYVEETPVTGDFGADLIANQQGERIVIQCKRYSYPVGVKAVQEAATAVKHYRAYRAVVVTNNKFTKQAYELAKTNKVELIDRLKLIEALYSASCKGKTGSLALILSKIRKPEI